MAVDIHPTAIVAAGAQLGDGCRVGPYCVIGDQAKIGTGTALLSHVIVDGDTTLGEHCTIYPFACIGQQSQDLKFKGGKTRVVIGNNTTLREYVTVHQPTADNGLTAIGDNCTILAYSHVAHDCLLGNGIIMSNSNNLGGHVIVEDNAVIGGMSGVHQFVRIGTGAMIGATAKVVQDVVPFGLVDGNPANLISINKIGMQRHGKDADTIRAVQRAFKLLFRSNLTLDKATAAVQEELGQVPEVQAILDFIAKSERGLTRPK